VRPGQRRDARKSQGHLSRQVGSYVRQKLLFPTALLGKLEELPEKPCVVLFGLRLLLLRRYRVVVEIIVGTGRLVSVLLLVEGRRTTRAGRPRQGLVGPGCRHRRRQDGRRQWWWWDRLCLQPLALWGGRLGHFHGTVECVETFVVSHGQRRVVHTGVVVARAPQEEMRLCDGRNMHGQGVTLVVVRRSLFVEPFWVAKIDVGVRGRGTTGDFACLLLGSCVRFLSSASHGTRGGAGNC
jgi:hypothetical protein